MVRKKIVTSSKEDDRLGELRSLRVSIANRLDNEKTAARDVASLSRRLIEIGREIDELLEAKERAEIVASADPTNAVREEEDASVDTHNDQTPGNVVPFRAEAL